MGVISDQSWYQATLHLPSISASGRTIDPVSNATRDSDRSFLIDTTSMEWHELPSRILSRNNIACGYIKADDGTTDIVVAGGCCNTDYVEVMRFCGPF